MLGSRLRSWMETHIVRTRKKQNKSKNKGNNPPDLPSTASSPIRDEADIETKVTRSSCKLRVEKLPMPKEKEKVTCVATNLSSPESAYSTGYSTDGTSPGASIPPEYYINLRTGKHYVQANTGNTGRTEVVQVCATQHQSPKQGAVLTPGLARRRRGEIAKKRAKVFEGLPESSTEEDIAGPKTGIKPIKVQKNNFAHNCFHRRTESHDDTQKFVCVDRDSEGSSSTHTVGSTIRSASPFLSSASPRQRNRIRTNPWLSANHNIKCEKLNYSSQGETSTVNSSSTLSSSGFHEKNTTEERFPLKAKFEDVGSEKIFQRPNYIESPLLNGRIAVTTCSPLPNRPCRHGKPVRSSSSSPSSAPSSGSDDHRGLSDCSDDDDDDDVTLNEMLGKYDESYVYEKETDILSDSDPTDCDDSRDYRDISTSLKSSQKLDDIDFIDTGSLADFNSDTEFTGKYVNRGHCVYVNSNENDQCKRHSSRTRRNRSRDESGGSSRGSSVSQRKRRRRIRHEEGQETPKLNKKRSLSIENRPEMIRVHDERRIDGKLNLNKVLMNRLINQRSGTRSADGTPISLRKNCTLEYNGKYLKNPHVSKLISNSVRHEEIKKDNEKYSYSPPVPPRIYPRIKECDKEGDLKYRKLIKEAECILEGFNVHMPPYMSPTLSTKSAIVPNTQPRHIPFRYPNECDIKSQINLIEKTINNSLPKIDNEEGIFRTISKTLEKIMIRNSEKKIEKAAQLKAKTDFVKPIEVFEEKCDAKPLETIDRNDNFYRNSFTFKSHKQQTEDSAKKTEKIGPVRLNVPKSLTLCQDDKLNNRFDENKPKTPLIPFKSFDLGTQVAENLKYCPQSEPVKRKVYSCSTTFDKLQKTLLSIEPDMDVNISDLSTDALRDENMTLKEKVAQLRKERLLVEARVRETQQQIDRLRQA